jgi:hypothetical protein
VPKPLFSGRATLLIALGLVVPEYLRDSQRALEPYPAVLLPKGSGKLQVKEGKIHLRRTFASGVRHGEWEKLDVGELMFPISEHYFLRLAGRDFGLKRSKHASPEQVTREQQTKNFFRARLAAQGFDTHKFRVVVEALTIELPSGQVLATHTVKKSTHELD